MQTIYYLVYQLSNIPCYHDLFQALLQIKNFFILLLMKNIYIDPQIMIKKLIRVFSTTKPIPQSPILGPIEIANPKVSDKSYYWCSCGQSKKQPFCDKSHKGTNFLPFRFTIEEKVDKVHLCGCKYTTQVPFCDGFTQMSIIQSRIRINIFLLLNYLKEILYKRKIFDEGLKRKKDLDAKEKEFLFKQFFIIINQRNNFVFQIIPPVLGFFLSQFLILIQSLIIDILHLIQNGLITLLLLILLQFRIFLIINLLLSAFPNHFVNCKNPLYLPTFSFIQKDLSITLSIQCEFECMQCKVLDLTRIGLKANFQRRKNFNFLKGGELVGKFIKGGNLRENFAKRGILSGKFLKKGKIVEHISSRYLVNLSKDIFTGKKNSQAGVNWCAYFSKGKNFRANFQNWDNSQANLQKGGKLPLANFSMGYLFIFLNLLEYFFFAFFSILITNKFFKLFQGYFFQILKLYFIFLL
ncbi:hypothetical protein pb186bvf_006091 [Paramecium bursaria]